MAAAFWLSESQRRARRSSAGMAGLRGPPSSVRDDALASPQCVQLREAADVIGRPALPLGFANRRALYLSHSYVADAIAPAWRCRTIASYELRSCGAITQAKAGCARLRDAAMRRSRVRLVASATVLQVCRSRGRRTRCLAAHKDLVRCGLPGSVRTPARACRRSAACRRVRAHLGKVFVRAGHDQVVLDVVDAHQSAPETKADVIDRRLRVAVADGMEVPAALDYKVAERQR